MIYIWDLENQYYLHQDEVESIINQLGLNYVSILYKGKFISWDHIKSFVGQTALGGSQGEGIVVKNMIRLNDPKSRR